MCVANQFYHKIKYIHLTLASNSFIIITLILKRKKLGFKPELIQSSVIKLFSLLLVLVGLTSVSTSLESLSLSDVDEFL